MTLLLFSNVMAKEPTSDMPLTNIHKTIASQTGWLNTSRPLTAEDLKGRIILLDFWTFCCINCIHVMPDLKYLEDKFGEDLTVIGVHSAKFANERDTENIRSAILRYDLHHPVVNDFDFGIWKKFGVRAWPTFVLINPDGIIEETYSGEGNRAAVEEDIETLRSKYAGKFVAAKLPIALEKDKAPDMPLSFPGKLAYAPAKDVGQLTVMSYPTLFVSDSGHHQIAIIELGETPLINTRIGSGNKGFKDGSFAEAEFNTPQGVLHQNGKLYIADTNNHALRVADLAARTVTTLAGTGKQGYERYASNADALATPLASPWDLAFYPDDTHIAIAMAGTHQLWSYDISAKTVSVIAGNGRESIDDGRYPYNSLSQPSGLAVHDGKLYFVDSETSSLRVLENGSVKTLIGTGLFDFGYKEGKQGEALMQHSIGVFADASGVYVADSYNHSIRRYDPATGLLSNFAGHGVRGKNDGTAKDAAFNEPNDVLKIGDALYVADTNNNVIRVLKNGKVSTLNVTRSSPYPSPYKGEGSSGKSAAGEGEIAFADEDSFPNLEKIAPIDIADTATISLDLKKGWKINHEAPSALALFDMSGTPKLVTAFSLKQIETKSLTLPTLKPGTYRLQGTLYYCEDKEGAQCLIKSFDVTLHAKPSGKKAVSLTVN